MAIQERDLEELRTLYGLEVVQTEPEGSAVATGQRPCMDV